MLQIRKEHFPGQPLPEAPAPSPVERIPPPSLPVREEQLRLGKTPIPTPESGQAASATKRRTLTVRTEQISQFSNSAHARFLGRVDAFLAADLGERWTKIPPAERAETLRKASDEGARYGFQEEIYRAQFIVLFVLLGPTFFASNQAKSILDEPDLGGPVKLFQLSHLGGIAHSPSEH